MFSQDWTGWDFPGTEKEYFECCTSCTSTENYLTISWSLYFDFAQPRLHDALSSMYMVVLMYSIIVSCLVKSIKRIVWYGPCMYSHCMYTSGSPFSINQRAGAWLIRSTYSRHAGRRMWPATSGTHRESIRNIGIRANNQSEWRMPPITFHLTQNGCIVAYGLQRNLVYAIIDLKWAIVA